MASSRSSPDTESLVRIVCDASADVAARSQAALHLASQCEAAAFAKRLFSTELGQQVSAQVPTFPPAVHALCAASRHDDLVPILARLAPVSILTGATHASDIDAAMPVAADEEHASRHPSVGTAAFLLLAAIASSADVDSATSVEALHSMLAQAEAERGEQRRSALRALSQALGHAVRRNAPHTLACARCSLAAPAHCPARLQAQGAGAIACLCGWGGRP